MNTKRPWKIRDVEANLLEKAEAIVRGFGLEWNLREAPPDRHGQRPDALVEIGRGQQQEQPIELVVEIKTQLRPAQIGAIFAQFQRFDRPGLLITDYVNPELADELRRKDIFFVDAVGNAFLRGEGLLIWVTGRRDTQKRQIAREKRRAFQPTGLRVIFALLRNPELVKETYRTLAAAADVALGTVQWVMRDLHEEGYLIRQGRTRRRLVDLAKLLDEWALGYARDLKNRLLLGRFETAAFAKWEKVDLRPYQAVWGGEPAAALLTHYLKPETLTLWVDEIPPRLLAELALRAAPKGRVEILKRFWGQEAPADGLDATVGEPRPQELAVAPPLLIYADLLATGDARAIETAMKIRNQWIHGPFERD